MPPRCPWRLARLGNGSAFCNDNCAHLYRRHLMPGRGDEHSGFSRPAPHATRKAMQAASRAAFNKRRWQQRAAP
jgi:hypothetical protein